MRNTLQGARTITMNFSLRIYSNRQRGQAIVLVLVFVLICATTLVLMYNTGQSASEKARLVNAADAAAYSGAVYIARNLNYMAYTNRAMIANHVAVGHLVSYVSWIRYVEQSASRLAEITSWIPYVGAATRAIAKWGYYVRTGTEWVATGYVPAASEINILLSESQLLADISGSSVLPMRSLMEKTAREYSPNIQVNNPAEVSGLSGLVSAASIAGEMSRIGTFIKQYDASNDDGRMDKMVSISLGSSRRFINGNRGWSKNLLLIRIQKSGHTSEISDGSLSDWSAADELTLGHRTIKGWSTTTLAQGSATAQEFDENYRGVPSYYELDADADDRDKSLTVTAYATVPLSDARPKKLLGMGATTEKLTALSRAEIYYQRPAAGYATVSESGEYANLFNPFWEVRLVSLP